MRSLIVTLVLCTAFAASHAAAAGCAGDCDGDGDVTILDLVRLVGCFSILDVVLPPCPCFADIDGIGYLTVTEVIAAVNNALDGCRSRADGNADAYGDQRRPNARTMQPRASRLGRGLKPSAE